MAEPISISTIASLCHLAWQVYKLCKDASGSFKNVSSEVLSLHAVLREAEENLTQHSDSKFAGLTTVVAGCRDILIDLETVVEKYRGLGSKTQRVWDRMGWHSEDIADLRMRLISNTGLLSAFMSSSQFAIEEKLDQLLKEIQNGYREGSIISTQTVDTISANEKEIWRAIRKELEDIGITTEAFDTNKGFIMQWFETALERGDFQEQDSDVKSDKVYGSDGLKDHEEINFQRHKGSQKSNPLAVKSEKERHLEIPQTRPRPSNLRSVAPPSRNRLMLNLLRVLPMYNSDLCKACDVGDLEKVTFLICQGANVNSSASTVWPQALLDLENKHSHFKWKGPASSIELAMMGGHDSVVSFLLQQNAHCDGRLLALATKYGTLETITIILNSNLRFREYSELGTALEYAFIDGQHDKVGLILPHVDSFIVSGKKRSHGIFNFLNGYNTYRPLTWAASSLNFDLVKSLITRGANTRVKSPSIGYPNIGHLPYKFRRSGEHLGEYPVLWLVAFQLPSNSDSRSVILALVGLLLANGADPNQDNTMLQLTAHGDIDVARLFMEFGGIAPAPNMIAYGKANWPENIVTQQFIETFSFP